MQMQIQIDVEIGVCMHIPKDFCNYVSIYIYIHTYIHSISGTWALYRDYLNCPKPRCAQADKFHAASATDPGRARELLRLGSLGEGASGASGRFVCQIGSMYTHTKMYVCFFMFVHVSL